MRYMLKTWFCVNHFVLLCSFKKLHLGGIHELPKTQAHIDGIRRPNNEVAHGRRYLSRRKIQWKPIL